MKFTRLITALCFKATIDDSTHFKRSRSVGAYVGLTTRRHASGEAAGFIAPCLPTSAEQPRSGEEWLHEIKHDGFRVIARRSADRVKLYSWPGIRPTVRAKIRDLSPGPIDPKPDQTDEG